MLSEKLQIWLEIRDSSSTMHQVGINPIEILRWAESRDLSEVRERIEEIRREKKMNVLVKFGKGKPTQKEKLRRI